MNKIFTYCYWVIMIVLITSCSNDGDISDNNNGLSDKDIADISIISQDQNAIYQIDVSNNGETISTVNLSEVLSLDNTDYLLDVHNDYISFIRRTGLNLNITQKKLTDQQFLIRQPICPLENNELAISATIANDAVVMFTKTEIDSEEFNHIRTYLKNVDQCNKIDLGSEPIVGEKFIKDGILYYTVARENGSFGIVQRNIQSMTILNEIDFSSVFKVTVNDERMLVFLPNDEVKILDLTTFEEVDNINVGFELINQNLGFFETVFDDNLMYFNAGYPQPSSIDEGPATINLETGNTQDGFNDYLFFLQDQLLAQLGEILVTETYTVDVDNKQLIFPTINQDNQLSGGIVYTNFEGEIIKFISTESVPFAIILRDF